MAKTKATEQMVDDSPILLNSVRIVNGYGIEQVEFSHGQFTLLKGGNATNKTSILNALRAVLQGGNVYQLLHNGADKGEVVLEFSNAYKARLGFTESGGKNLTVKDPDGRSVDSPQSWLKSISDALRCDPTKFLQVKQGERVEYLLEAMPLRMSPEHREQLKFAGVELLEGVSDLEALEKARDLIFKQRTEVNRQEKNANASVTKLRESLPNNAEDGDDIIVKAHELRAALKEQESSLEEQLKQIDRDLNTKVSAEAVRYSEAKAAVQTEFDRRLREIETWRANQLTTEALTNTSNLASIRSEDEKLVELVRQDLQPSIDELRAELATYEERERNLIASQKLLESIRDFEREANQHADLSSTLTERLAHIDTVRLDMLSALPIKGLEIREGDIFVNGVCWELLNTATKIDIAVEVALLNAGPLKLVILDYLEHLDLTNRELLLRKIAAAGLTVIGALVTDGPLTIETN